MAKRQPPDRPRESQRDKFMRTARELGCDEDPETFKRVMQKFVAPGSNRDATRTQEYADNK